MGVKTVALKICLDAGHYGKYNQSPAIPEYYESDMNWKLHLMLKKYLEEYGVEVTTTRTNQETDLGLQARGNKSKGCDLFISIHSNAVGSGVNESVDYPVVYVPINGTGDELGKKLAECVESVMETNQKGEAKSRKGSGDWDYYSVIYGAVAVGVTGLIIEHSFHTNTRATQWLLDDSNLDKMAKAEADVIAAHYGLKKAEETQYLYRVQVGAYSVKANAEAQLKKIQDAGFTDAFIVASEVENELPEPWEPEVGDIVMFNGSMHYTSADATNGIACTPGKATITRIYQPNKSKHPYHLVRVDSSGPHGWVNADSFTKI